MNGPRVGLAPVNSEVSSPKGGTGRGTGRRTVVCGAAIAGLGMAAAGCAGSGRPDASTTPTEPVDLGPASAVPVGGARLFRERRLLVCRPAQDRFRAFSAVCTHAGCVLDEVTDGAGSCPCHGSRFDVTSGEVLAGPADAALPAVPVRVRDGRLVAGPEE